MVMVVVVPVVVAVPVWEVVVSVGGGSCGSGTSGGCNSFWF